VQKPRKKKGILFSQSETRVNVELALLAQKLLFFLLLVRNGRAEMIAFLYSLRRTDQSVKKPRTRKNALNTRLALPDPKPSNTSSIGNTYHGASRLAEQGVNG
jgi:hypothetical protein